MRGDRLKSARELRGLSQQELGDRVGLHRQQIYVYEKGEGNPSIDLLERIATELEVSIDYLIGLADTPADHYREDELTQQERALFQAIRTGRVGDALKYMGDIFAGGVLANFIATSISRGFDSDDPNTDDSRS